LLEIWEEDLWEETTGVTRHLLWSKAISERRYKKEWRKAALYQTYQRRLGEVGASRLFFEPRRSI
jgi:hypothetical protein